MGTRFFDLMNIDSFQQEATDIDRSEYVSPRTNIKLSFHGDGALPLELDIHAIYETSASIYLYIYIKLQDKFYDKRGNEKKIIRRRRSCYSRY